MTPEGFSKLQPGEEEIRQTKQFNQELEDILRRLKAASDIQHNDADTPGIRASSERCIAAMKIQEAIMWLERDLKAVEDNR